MKDIRQERRLEAYTADFIAMQGELPEINKDGMIVIEPKEGSRNRRTQKTPFATFENLERICRPIYLKHRFAIQHSVIPGDPGIIVHTVLKHSAGHESVSDFPLIIDSSGSKNNIQGLGSSFSYGKRYNTIGLLNIISFAPQDRDHDGVDQTEQHQEPVATIDAKQISDLTEAIERCGVPMTMFCTKYEVEKVADLPRKMFAEAMAACAKFKRPAA